jgi:hypothetical protein
MDIGWTLSPGPFLNMLMSLAFLPQGGCCRFPYKGDEFHHFGWNACSSALSPLTGHAFLERRYLSAPPRDLRKRKKVSVCGGTKQVVGCTCEGLRNR